MFPINIAEVTLNSNSINTTIVDGVVNISDVYMVSGNVTYYSNDTSINGVDIFLDGSNEYHVTTDADGEYSIQEVVTDDYTMTATKNDDVNGITAFDATMVLRSSVGLESFDILQTIAADVNSDGVVNSMDAAQILQFVAGIRVLPFEGTGVIWKFNPEEYSYIDIEQNMFNQDLKAILVGDVTGNYSPSSDTASLFDTDGVLKIGTFTETESQLLVPIEINYYDYDLYSFETTIMFDHGVTVHDIVFAKELEQCFIVTNTQNDNMIRIAVACTNPVDINGIAFQIIFNKGVEMPDQFHMIVQDTYLNEYENILELTSVYNGYLNPDLNNDGIIDENDIKLMVEDYNMTYNEADISIYDFNSDGIIDIYDIIKNNSTE